MVKVAAVAAGVVCVGMVTGWLFLPWRVGLRRSRRQQGRWAG